VQDAVQKYAEDFDSEAAEKLLAFARRQVLLQESNHLRMGRQRGR
jgi:hypothetical protein